MNEELRKTKQIIREWIRAQYTDERLAEVLAFAQDGKFGFASCCCLVGVVTAKHAFVQEMKHVTEDMENDGHYSKAMRLPHAQEAEFAFLGLGDDRDSRLRLIIPILKAEIRRRDQLAQASKLREPEVLEQVNKGELVV